MSNQQGSGDDQGHPQNWTQQTYDSYSRGNQGRSVQQADSRWETRKAHPQHAHATYYQDYRQDQNNGPIDTYQQPTNNFSQAFGNNQRDQGAMSMPSGTQGDSSPKENNNQQAQGSWHWNTQFNCWAWVPSSNASRSGYGTGQSNASGTVNPNIVQPQPNAIDYRNPKSQTPSVQLNSSYPRHSPDMSLDAPNPVGQGAAMELHCPYGCGTVLTGVHAAGNLTRHLKSQTCTGSKKPKDKVACPVYGCGKEYTRSDGLKVHIRKSHPEYLAQAGEIS